MAISLKDPRSSTALALAATATLLLTGCDGTNEARYQPDSVSLALTPALPLSANYQRPTSKQGTSEAYYSVPADQLERRYQKLHDIGIGYRQYNYWWSMLESSGIASSTAPISCPSCHSLVPTNEAERTVKGYLRYRCVNNAQVEFFDKLLEQDAAKNMQSSLVLWSSAPQYRYPGCLGFRSVDYGNQVIKDPCVPRDDAMDDFEDYINFIAQRYNGGAHGKVTHWIIWNENGSDDWFDYTPVAPKDSLNATHVDLRVSKYVNMMRRAHSAISRHMSGAMLYASVDNVWLPTSNLPGHMGTKTLLDKLWDNLGTTISWSVAAHPYGSVDTTPSEGYNFANIQMVVDYQKQKLLGRGITDVDAYPQSYIIASEQGWPDEATLSGRARIICQAHVDAMRVPNLLAAAHLYFYSVDPNQPSTEGGQKGFFGLLPPAAGLDLGGMFNFPTGLAYASTNPFLWNRSRAHYCCTAHGIGCAPAATNHASPLGYLDGAVKNANGVLVSGWACVIGLNTSVTVHFYIGGPAGSGAKFFQTTANVFSGQGVNSQCNAQGNHRFELQVNPTDAGNLLGKPIYAYLISPIGSSNGMITESGKRFMPTNTDGQQVTIYRLRHPNGDYMNSRSSIEGNNVGYVTESTVFQAYTIGDNGRHPIYRCLGHGHYTSLDSGCEGAGSKEHTLGYLLNTGPSNKIVARCRSLSTGYHMTVTQANACSPRLNGFTQEAVLGYQP